MMRTFVKTECTLLILVAGLLLAGCGKKDADSSGESEEQAPEQQSVFIFKEDSIRWVSHLRANPEDTAQAYIMLGVLYLANDYPEITIRYLTMAERYDPGRAITYLNLGDAYNRIGIRMKSEGKKDSMEIMYKKAEEAFKWYVQRAPRGEVAEEIFRIVEKYKSIESEKKITR